MEPNLAALGETMPGAGGTCVWTADGRVVDLPELAGVGVAVPLPLPRGTVAVGAAWPIAHVADQVRLVFAGRPPKGEDLELEVFDGCRWVRYADGLAAGIDGKAVELSFEPVAAEGLRVPLAADSGVVRVEIRRYLAQANSPVCPTRVRTGELSRQILARDEEPSFESLRLYGLSMPAWAMMGLKDSGYEQAVYWDGQIHCDGRRILISLGEPPVRLADVRDTVRRTLMDGWMPAVVVQAQVGQVAVKQTSFVAFADEAQAQPATFVRVELSNLGTETFEGPLCVEVREAPADPFEGTMGVEIFNPPRDTAPSAWQFRQGMLVRNGRPFIVSAHQCRAGREPSALMFEVKLEPGRTGSFDFAAPSPPWQATAAEGAGLAQFPCAAALAGFRAYWDRLLAPAMVLDLPEARLNHLHRAVLAQLFINAYGDIMPYGAAPSSYDGCVYGVEEGYAMLALATSGFTADAQRYMDATYLRKEFLAKPQAFEKPEDRNQQIKNGEQPALAVELFRLSGDRQWIARHLKLAQECAEWTIASRRKTMQLEDGRKPPHYGLLPEWAYGGDIHQLCHPLFPNFANWRGLKDTAWLMEQFDEAALAARYRQEADEYRRTILAVVDALYRKEARPPFLPLRTDAAKPDSGDFYQLFAGILMDLLPFEFSDPRADYLGDFLEQDNRTFCLLPRFRREGIDGGAGIDALYGLGHVLSRLHQNRIREFLLGFYAYQAFNMEHACFTSREQNRLYCSDLHLRTPYPVSDWSDPLPCSSAVCLLLLRHMLVTEESLGAAQYTGKLLLLYGAPRRWFAAGGRIAVEGAVTHAGKVSFVVTVDADRRRIRAQITMAGDSKCPAVKIRLRHPEGKPMKSVTINGVRAATFDALDELVEVPSPAGTALVEAHY